MTDPRSIKIEDYTYHLPQGLIANYPLPERDSSRLLVFNGAIQESTFRHLANFLPPHSTLVFNNSRVVEARLLLQKPTGATIEIFCLEPDPRYGDITHAFAQTGNVYWKCMVGNAASWNAVQVLTKKVNDIELQARLVERQHDHFLIHLSWSDARLSFAELLHEAGVMPLPPYIKRKAENLDESRYQTIYAQPPGSVAAPTAGLHFTDRVLNDLKGKSINTQFVTLHVGAGTFKPVKSATLEGHDMHSETIEVHRNLISNLAENIRGSIVAVGTTSLRTLESLYWIGKIIHSRPSVNEAPQITQWTPYDNTADVSAGDALNAIITWMDTHNKETLVTRTSLLIAPGYSFRIVNALVTNFHQPGSTLLLLIAAFIGENWKSVYSYALENEFRFLSYGDSCLLFRQRQVHAYWALPG